MKLKFNPHISVDCVVFGFDYKELKVLLQEREVTDTNNNQLLRRDLKLPGDLIAENELLNDAAYRILLTATGLNNIYLQKFEVFDAIDRMNDPIDRMWLEKKSELKIDRVITMAYYALVKLDEAKLKITTQTHKTQWINVNDVKKLAFDHLNIFSSSLEHLRRELKSEPLVFELLPNKFSIRQVQNLYEIILGVNLDNRNFRKKFLKLPYIKESNEKEQNVNHKPAILYKFDKKLYKQSIQNKNDFIL